MNHRLTRREALRMLGAAAAVASLPSRILFASEPRLVAKTIPGTGQSLPVIGMGTWRTFNVGNDPRLLAARTEVVRAFFRLGGGLVDSSPMYGSAPDVMGHALQQLGVPESLFSAEKVWSPAGGAAREQVTGLAGRWGLERFDLVQVHNLTDWREHLAALQDMKAEGKVGFVGITTSHGRRHQELEELMASREIDFVQLSYNIDNRDAEARLLPLARDRGIAVIANRPYGGGRLIRHLQRKGEPIPSWARDAFDCQTWADFLLKFIVSHPAVNCAIPATTRVEHMEENMNAGRGEMPSGSVRDRMVDYFRSI